MKRTSQLIVATSCIALLSACTAPDGRPNAGVLQGGNPNKTEIGTVIGAVGGGFLGNQIGGGSGKAVATVGGALLGGFLGNSIGQSLDQSDMLHYDRTSQGALEQGQPGQAFPWKNSQTGNSGTVTPGTFYQVDNGSYCREFTQNITVGGRTERAFGTACRQPDGSWRIVEG